MITPGPAYPLELGLEEVKNDAHTALLGRTTPSLASKKIKLYVISGNCDGLKLTECEDEVDNEGDENAENVGENEAENLGDIEAENVGNENAPDVGQNEGENATDVGENEGENAVVNEGDNVADNEAQDDDSEDIYFNDSEDGSDNNLFSDYIDATVNEAAAPTRSEAPNIQPSTSTCAIRTEAPNISEDEHLDSELESEQLYSQDDSDDDGRRQGYKYNPIDMGPNFGFKLASQPIFTYRTCDPTPTRLYFSLLHSLNR
ncbi:ring-infected erythrocyte surface antigen [Canna indica]|uniref:Ring-infected erythrocyte surface antigen n=1 Tax=Canna indica TaxID=4628 RepID=A0AAQ3QR22_9LILI|nr:ring-infected erythrocyte surface antigen [Canna indica]